MHRVPSTLAERLMAKVDKTWSDKGCWLFEGARVPFGYGQLRRDSNPQTPKVLAHRASWEVHRGPIPRGMLVLHHCDVPNCVNPDHLYLGTFQDNTRDMIARKRNPMLVAKTHCRRGHAFDEKNTRLRPRDGRTRRECRACNLLHTQNWLRRQQSAA